METFDPTELITSRRITEATANLRDLAITNNKEVVTSSGTLMLSSLGKMDHFPIYVTTDLPSSPSTIQIKTMWDCSRLDAGKLTRLMQDTDWDEILDVDINIATEKFTQVIL